MRRIIHPFSLLFVSIFALILTSCGGGGSGGTTSNTVGVDTGTVTLLVTDGPTDDFNAINLTMTRAELLSDGGMVTLFEGIKRFDLLQLANATEIFSVTEVPTGTYNKIRLTLTEIELVLRDGTRVYPDLPGNGKVDLTPAGSFQVTANTPLMIQLDMDAEKSIHTVRAGGSTRYQFRPVVFIDVVRDSQDTKLVRLQGTVSGLDATRNVFDLCRIYAQGHLIDDDSRDSRSYCVQVNTTGDQTAFFDDEAAAIAFGDLADGDVVTVAGRLVLDRPTTTTAVMHRNREGREDRDRDREDDNSRDRDRDRDDDRSRDDRSSDDSSDDDSSDDDNGREPMVLSAELVWKGNYLEMNGIARSAVNTDTNRGSWFEYEVLSGDGVISDTPVPTILQPGSRLYSVAGLPLDASAIQPGVPARVNGVLDLDTGDLKGVLFILDTEFAAGLEQLTGVIGDLSGDYTRMNIQMDGVDYCVDIDIRETRVFEVSITSGENVEFTQKTAYDLQNGLQTDVFGGDLNGCLQADTIIYEADSTTPEPALLQPLP